MANLHSNKRLNHCVFLFPAIRLLYPALKESESLVCSTMKIQKKVHPHQANSFSHSISPQIFLFPDIIPTFARRFKCPPALWLCVFIFDAKFLRKIHLGAIVQFAKNVYLCTSLKMRWFLWKSKGSWRILLVKHWLSDRSIFALREYLPLKQGLRLNFGVCSFDFFWGQRAFH